MTGARAGAGAGLRVGQAYGVFYLPGFGLAVPAPWLLGTQLPFALTTKTIKVSQIYQEEQTSVLSVEGITCN